MKRIIPILIILFLVLGFISCLDLSSEISLLNKSTTFNTDDRAEGLDNYFNLKKIEKDDSENPSKQERKRKRRGVNLSVFYLLIEFVYIESSIEKDVTSCFKEIYFLGLFTSNEKRGPPTFFLPI